MIYKPVPLDHLRNRHFFVFDAIAIVFASYLSYVLRFETWQFPTFHQQSLIIFSICAVLAVPLIFHSVGVYSRYWKYASLNDFILICLSVVVATAAASLMTIGVIWLGKLSAVFPRSIPFLFFMIALGAVFLPRLFVRVFHLMRGRVNGTRQRQPGRRIAIMGAGDAGEILVRELKQNTRIQHEIVAFLDDNPRKHGVRIHGIRVIGGRQKIPHLQTELGVSELIIAMPSIDGRMVREIVQLSEKAGLKAKIIPGLQELLEGENLFGQLRSVAIEDLLRRQPIKTDFSAVQNLLQGRRVLITGGGGSIGSELCRQIIRCQPSELVLLGHGENSIFGIFHELKRLKIETKITAVIADIRFEKRIKQVFAQFQPEVVFHAAAHKHVPLMEANPVEAITNNVLGTRNLLTAALEQDVDHFVMISTDKAVNPTNVMGASKRSAELLVHHAAERSGKAYVAVRFGNVLGSRGSVVLTFQDQIKRGGPVTVTHPEMTRFFMTIPEAVQLVLQAAVLGNGGEVFVLDMGQPVKILDLAKDLITLSGLEVDRDIKIEFVGLRPGEKLYEELFVKGEDYQRTRHEKIFLAANASNLIPAALETRIGRLIEAAEENHLNLLMEELHELVPEFSHNGSVPQRR
ncbi:MAG: nucleoside-diphosphate sugar epimerase/dehydratase [Ardenticatenaceae bacterium]|nr:nucleoside-diphosphate sugar epimerase/dehydratase [Ardenticatenaceae bacterium]